MGFIGLEVSVTTVTVRLIELIKERIKLGEELKEFLTRILLNGFLGFHEQRSGCSTLEINFDFYVILRTSRCSCQFLLMINKEPIKIRVSFDQTPLPI